MADMMSDASVRSVFVAGEPVLSGERDQPWKDLINSQLDFASERPALTFIVSALRRRGHPFDLDNLVHPVLFVMKDPIEHVSARLFVGEPVGVLIESSASWPARPPLRSIRVVEHSAISARGRSGIPSIADDPVYDEHEGVGLALGFDSADVPIRKGWYGPTEAVIDDLKPWLGTYTSRALISDHRMRELHITRGVKPRGMGVTIDLWYVPDEHVLRLPGDVAAKLRAR